MTGEDILKLLISSGDPNIVQQVESEITLIMEVIIDELNKGTRFYKASTMEKLEEVKDIFKALVNNDIHFRPTKERELEYIDMFQRLEKVEWV